MKQVGRGNAPASAALTRRWRIAALAVLALPLFVAQAPAAPAAEEDSFWHDVTLRLEGALPNQHPRLADGLELYLGRDEQGKWRKYVLGYAAFFDEGNVTTKVDKLYNWMDHEGTLAEVAETGDAIHMVVDMTINSDPWVLGGTARYTFDLRRDGNALSGVFSGVYTKRAATPADDGPAGDRPCRGRVAGRIRPDLWPSPVPGPVPLAAGEHPRLLFRKTDVPELKRRAETPEGKAILARLASMLEGEKMDLWHAYGYGLMYQLTGDQKWADLARKNAEDAIADRIKAGRYGWYTRDGGYLRVGPSVASTAAAYDMCYDAWDAGFRQTVARKIQDRLFPKLVHQYDLGESDGQLNPRSNHYMNWNGGAGFAMLAVKGDPGTDDAVTARSHRIFLERLKRGLLDGFGDHGWFYEGTFCGRFPTNGGLAPYLQALRVAEGRDYVTGCSQAQWLTSKWCFEVLRSGGKVDIFMRLMYARGFEREGGAGGGDFAQGFGILPPDHAPAVLWFYNRVLEPGEKTHDAFGPKQAAYAFVNWPIGLQEKDPAQVFGHVLHDEVAGFYVFRSGWQGEGDIVVSLFGNAVVIGLGVKTQFAGGLPAGVRPFYFHKGEDKSFSVSARTAPAGTGEKSLSALAVDFSGLSGAPALLAGVTVTGEAAAGGAAGQGAAATAPQPEVTDEQRAALRKIFAGSSGGAAAARPGTAAGADGASTRTVRLTAAGREFVLMTVQKGPAPAARVVGQGADQKVVVGRRTLAFDGEKIVLGTGD